MKAEERKEAVEAAVREDNELFKQVKGKLVKATCEVTSDLKVVLNRFFYKNAIITLRDEKSATTGAYTLTDKVYEFENGTKSIVAFGF